jgi:hypothetical protein
LRLLDVPGERIGQILAEVETHVADTGLDSVDAFGEPGEYAATYAVAANSPIAQGGSRHWLRDLGIAGVSATACGAATLGAFHLTGSVELTARLLGTWLVTVGIVLVVVRLILGLFAGHTAGSVKPRTLPSRYAVFGWLAMMAGPAMVVLVQLLVPTSPTVPSVPGWVLVVAGVLAMFALVRHLGGLNGDRVVDPRN